MLGNPVKHVTLVMADNSVRTWRDIDARVEEHPTDYSNGKDPHVVVTVTWTERFKPESLPEVTAEEEAVLKDE